MPAANDGLSAQRSATQRTSTQTGDDDVVGAARLDLSSRNAHQLRVLVVEHHQDDRRALVQQRERAVLERAAAVALRVHVCDLHAAI